MMRIIFDNGDYVLVKEIIFFDDYTLDAIDDEGKKKSYDFMDIDSIVEEE